MAIIEIDLYKYTETLCDYESSCFEWLRSQQDKVVALVDIGGEHVPAKINALLKEHGFEDGDTALVVIQ